MNSFSCCTRRIDKLAQCQVQIVWQQEVIDISDFEEVLIISIKKSVSSQAVLIVLILATRQTISRNCGIRPMKIYTTTVIFWITQKEDRKLSKFQKGVSY